LAKKFHVIWNGYDPQDGFGPKPLPARPYRLLAHVGVMYSLRHPVALVNALARLIANGRLDPRSFRLRQIGPVEQESQFVSLPAVASLIAQQCLEIQSSLVPRPQALSEIATADFLLLVDIVNLSNSGYTVPAKLYDYVLAGRPILAITDRQSPVDRILAQAGLRYMCLFHGDSEEEMDRKLLEFFRSSSNPLPPSVWFQDNFDGSRQATVLASLLNKTLNKTLNQTLLT
jgi:hypothetical protein